MAQPAELAWRQSRSPRFAAPRYSALRGRRKNARFYVSLASIMSSTLRSRDFADEVMRITEGKGLDVVLNSLAGEAIGKNFRLLKPFGRFLEIGKRDIYANSKIGLRPFRNNLTYFGIDADTLLSERRGLATRLIAELMQLFERGELRPLPNRSFPISRAGEAFRQMQQSRHVGKLVIAIDDGEVQPVIQRQVTVRNDTTYLISGGLGGFGLATARWWRKRVPGTLR